MFAGTTRTPMNSGLPICAGRWIGHGQRLRDLAGGLYLVCRPTLDLYWGVAGRYRRRYGNLRREDAQAVVQAAVAKGGERSEHAIWFDLDPIPDVCELAEQHGDPGGSACICTRSRCGVSGSTGHIRHGGVTGRYSRWDHRSLPNPL
jgi:hypothetical protein